MKGDSPGDLLALSTELKVRSKQEKLGEFCLYFHFERRVRAVCKVYSLRINGPCCPDYQVALAQPQPSYKTPIHMQPRGSAPPEGEHAILKLQLPHTPQSAKLELLSASCVLQQERQVCSGARCLSCGLGGRAWKWSLFLYTPFSDLIGIHEVTDFSHIKCLGSLKPPTMIISHKAIWFLSIRGPWYYQAQRNKWAVTHR